MKVLGIKKGYPKDGAGYRHEGVLGEPFYHVLHRGSRGAEPLFPCGARTVEVFAYPIGKEVHGAADGIVVLRGAGSRVGGHEAEGSDNSRPV